MIEIGDVALTFDNDLNNIAQQLVKILDCGKGKGQIPGAVFGLVTANGNCGCAAAGDAQIFPETRRMTLETWFDLASLTKVMFTTRIVLELVAEGRIGLDDELSAHIPDLRQYDIAGAPERKLTISQCLAHQTFLPAVEPLYTLGLNPATLKAYVLQRAWEHGPPVYSDINFILLGILIERVSGKPLSAHQPGDHLGFGADAAHTAATEYCQWRERLICGEVHDENAYALGRLAGHAGLFGTIKGVLGFAHQLLQSGEVAELMRQRQSPTRTLGWEIKHDGWPGGDACSAATIGHTGFTGTGLWIDFERQLAWSLLTNRVHPSRHGETGIAVKRRRISDEVVAAMARSHESS